MPPGSIPDPRQNPKEREFGIIKVNGIYAYYDKDKNKKKDSKRFMPAGFELDVTEDNLEQTPDIAVYWNGMVINTKCTVPDETVVNAVNNLDNQPPLAKEMFIWLSEEIEGEDPKTKTKKIKPRLVHMIESNNDWDTDYPPYL